MKLAWQVIALLCVIHMLLAGAFVAWLSSSGRVNAERVEAAVALFRPTIVQQKAEAEAAAKVEADAQEHAANVQFAAEGGPVSAAQRLSEERQRNELTLRQLERTRQEVRDLQDNLAQRQSVMEQQRQELLAEKEALQKRVDELEQRYNDEGFRKAVTMYEALPPKQTKQMFQSLMDSQQTDEVISYLEAMQPRKAAAVLKEFKTPQELVQAAELTQRLRERGSTLTADADQTS